MKHAQICEMKQEDERGTRMNERDARSIWKIGMNEKTTTPKQGIQTRNMQQEGVR